MKNEKDVKAAIRKLVKAYGGYYAMPIGTGFGKQGVPDFLICMQGRFIAVEAKFGSRPPTALQNEQIRQIRAAGGIALVINEVNLGDLRHVLESIMAEGLT